MLIGLHPFALVTYLLLALVLDLWTSCYVLGYKDRMALVCAHMRLSGIGFKQAFTAR
jgi:hypothetical protein